MIMLLWSAIVILSAIIWMLTDRVHRLEAWAMECCNCGRVVAPWDEVETGEFQVQGEH